MNSSPNNTLRSVFCETAAPFTILLDSKIPDLTEERNEQKEERQSSLRRIPKHKTDPSYSGTNFAAEKLMSAPLTM